MDYSINHLKVLEAESIYVMVHLAYKAFFPAKIPFPLLHIDTGHNFPETIKFRDDLVEKMGAKLIVGSVQEAIDKRMVTEEKGVNASRNGLQTAVLLESLEKGKYNAALGGARRDEEKARAKERFFSHRDEFGQWDPKNQRPELWNIFNGKHHMGEHFRVFPISNWTELDVWQYLAAEKVELPSLYYAHERDVFERDGTLLADCDYIEKKPGETVFKETVRCRTIGDMTCTGVWKSDAKTTDEISMEDRKKKGYF